jgi:hypothetical protein
MDAGFGLWLFAMSVGAGPATRQSRWKAVLPHSRMLPSGLIVASFKCLQKSIASQPVVRQTRI